MKIGRNDPCWCGSGKKYKKCHIDRDKQPAVAPWQVDALRRGERSRSACLYVEVANATGVCGKPAIASHNVPRKMLKQIARDGHVYCQSATLQDFTKAGGRPLLKPMGVNKASTLPLFCSKHDSEVFAPLEQDDFAGTPEQCFLLAYRAVCNECLKKRNQRDGVALQKTLDRGKTVQQQMEIQTMIGSYELAVEAGFLDVARQKLEFDKALAERDFSRLRSYVITFEEVPPVLASGALSPECDFDGQTLQNLGTLEARLDVITHSLIATKTGGAFVFAWLDISNGASHSLAQSLDRVRDDKIANTVLRFVFEFSENHHVNPEWWEGLDEAVRQAVLDRFARSTDPTTPRIHAMCLKDDGVSAVDWKVTARRWAPFPPIISAMSD